MVRLTYVFSKSLNVTFDEAATRTRGAIAKEGFDVITEIDIQKTLKAKIGVDCRRYLILGACNPGLAYEALKLEANVGAMLPCNVVVQKGDDEEALSMIYAKGQPSQLAVICADRYVAARYEEEFATADLGAPPGRRHSTP